MAGMATTVAYADRLQSLQLQVEELRAALQDAQQGQENLFQIVQDMHAKLESILATSPASTASRVDDLFDAVDDIDAKLEALALRAPRPPKEDTKTAARIIQVSNYLKSHGGMAKFKTLRHMLGISPSEFTYLVSRMDKRTFLVTVDNRAKDEKVLRLRAFI